MKHKPMLPNKWNENLAYLCGLITGDGSMPIAKSKRTNQKTQIRYNIYFYSNSYDFLIKVYLPIFKNLFKIDPYIQKNKFGKNKNVHNCRIESIELYYFLKKLGLKTGKKARVAVAPKMPNKLKIHYLAGLMDTDGGKKGSGFGISTASKYIAKFCEDLLKDLNIPYSSCPWEYKNHIYHQIYVTKRNLHKFREQIPIRNIEKIKTIDKMLPQ
jgi:hypothetical protein